MRWLYLDNNATTRPAAEVVAAMEEVHQTLWANPSSVHRFGQMVRQRIELARVSVAALIGCRDRELVFTSGGTEANNLALHGTLGAASLSSRLAAGILITSRVEHAAIREPADALARRGVRVVDLPIDHDGRVSVTDLAAALEETSGGTTPDAPPPPVVVSLQWANNETGVIQPVAALAEAVRGYRAAYPRARVLFHVDATQAVGKLAVNVAEARVDLLTLAAHKFHGPKGAGALFIRNGVRLTPQQRGGPQERDRRGGTENTAGIIGMGVAADLARAFLADAARLAELGTLRDRFERGVDAALPEMNVVVNPNGIGRPSGGTAASLSVSPAASGPERLWNTSNLGFPRLEAEAILLGLSEQGLCASAGAACSSGSLEPSPVLLAMGIPPEVAHGSVRFSLSRVTTEEEIDEALAIVPAVVRRLAKALPVTV